MDEPRRRPEDTVVVGAFMGSLEGFETGLQAVRNRAANIRVGMMIRRGLLPASAVAGVRPIGEGIGRGRGQQTG